MGEFTLAIPVSNQPRLIKSFGGSYIDEADQEPDILLKRKITFTAEQGLSSVLLPNQTSVAITIASTALIAKTKIESTSNNFFETLRLNQTNAANAFGFNIIDTVPADTLTPSTTATVTQMQYALVLGGLANLANRFALELGFSEPNFSIIEAIIHDFSDGIVDGQYQGVPLEYLNKYGEQQALPQDISLNEQINRFQNNNSNNFSQTPSITINEQLLQQPQITTKIPKQGKPISLQSSGQHIEQKKNNAIGRGSMNKAGNKISFKNVDTNLVNSKLSGSSVPVSNFI